MNVVDPDLVIVRGINSDWFSQNFTEMWIGFGDAAVAIPKLDSNYVGLYLEAPVSAITHIGIVERIERHEKGADFYLKALIKLKQPIDPGHQIRKHEYWKLKDLGLSELILLENHLDQNVVREIDNFPIQTLSVAGFKCYLTLTNLAYNYSIIDEKILFARFAELSFLLRNSDQDSREELDRLIESYGEQYSRILEVSYQGKLSQNKVSQESRSGQSVKREHRDPVIHLITRISGKISKWNIHPFDEDPFPSIPHGHALVNNNLKLDAYLGHIYNKGEWSDRESRNFMISLWNDEKFRNTARSAILYYLEHHPEFTWKVADPLKLPRRRKI
jgi:hypothetical protein